MGCSHLCWFQSTENDLFVKSIYFLSDFEIGKRNHSTPLDALARRFGWLLGADLAFAARGGFVAFALGAFGASELLSAVAAAGSLVLERELSNGNPMILVWGRTTNAAPSFYDSIMIDLFDLFCNGNLVPHFAKC